MARTINKVALWAISSIFILAYLVSMPYLWINCIKPLGTDTFCSFYINFGPWILIASFAFFVLSFWKTQARKGLLTIAATLLVVAFLLPNIGHAHNDFRDQVVEESITDNTCDSLRFFVGNRGAEVMLRDRCFTKTGQCEKVSKDRDEKCYSQYLIDKNEYGYDPSPIDDAADCEIFVRVRSDGVHYAEKCRRYFTAHG